MEAKGYDYANAADGGGRGRRDGGYNYRGRGQGRGGANAAAARFGQRNAPPPPQYERGSGGRHRHRPNYNHRSGGGYNTSSTPPWPQPATTATGDDSIIMFPFRRFHVTRTESLAGLRALVNAAPVVVNEVWSIPDGKVVWRTDGWRVFTVAPVVAKPATVIDPATRTPTPMEEHWRFDRIADTYTERARVASRGFGASMTPIEAWPSVAARPDVARATQNARTAAVAAMNLREAIAASLQEVRPAYASISTSIIAALRAVVQQRKRENGLLGAVGASVSVGGGDMAILDIAGAYGERFIAAAANRVGSYTAIDPDTNLCVGLSRLRDDLAVVTADSGASMPAGASLALPIEGFDPVPESASIVLASPPPFSTETYGGGAEAQAHRRYASAEDWFAGFMLLVLRRSYSALRVGGVFGITILDREARAMPPPSGSAAREFATSDVGQMHLVYTEATLLAAVALGFEYIGALGYATGGKPATTPWWVFQKIRTLDVSRQRWALASLAAPVHAVQPRGLALVASAISPPPTVPPSPSPSSVGDISSSGITTNVTTAASIIEVPVSVRAEIVRAAIAAAVVENFRAALPPSLADRAPNAISRWIMTAAIYATPESPQLDGSAIDPLFTAPLVATTDEADTGAFDEITYGTTPTDADSDVRDIDAARAAVFSQTYVLGDGVFMQRGTGIRGLIEAAATATLNTLTSTVMTAPATRFWSDIRLAFGENAGDVAKTLDEDYGTHTRPGDDVETALAIRYGALGAEAHHLTRPIERASLIAAASGNADAEIVDLFASYMNVNGPHFYSTAVDLERYLGSSGSAFTATISSGVIIANPVDHPPFVDAAVRVVLRRCFDAAAAAGTQLFVSAGFTLWLGEHDAQNKALVEAVAAGDGARAAKLIPTTTSTGLRAVAATFPSLLRAVYILDSDKFPTTVPDPVMHLRNAVVGRRSERVRSVGAIIATDAAWDRRVADPALRQLGAVAFVV